MRSKIKPQIQIKKRWEGEKRKRKKEGKKEEFIYYLETSLLK